MKYMSTYLEEFEDNSAVSCDHFEQWVKVSAVRGLAVGGTQGEGEEIQHGRDHQGSCVVHLDTSKQ